MEVSMSTPFLSNFSLALVTRLLASKDLEVPKGHEQRVIDFLAAYLHEHGKGSSLLSAVEKAFIVCDSVEEFYADQETLKAIVETLKYGG